MTHRVSLIYRSEDWQTPWLSRRARLSPHAAAIDWEGSVLDYAELKVRMDAMLDSLAGSGVERGSVVAVSLGNGLSISLLVHAAFAGDFVLQMVSTRLRIPEIEFQLRDSGAGYFIHRADDPVAEAVELEEGVVRLRLGSGEGGFLPRREPAGPGSRVNGSEVLDLRAPRWILYTSGTTGRPKGVVLSGENVLASANGSAALLESRESDKWLLCLPIYHVGGLSILLRSVLAGSQVVLHESYSPEHINRDLDRKGVTGISLVASMLAGVLADRVHAAPPASLDCVLLGGGPVPASLELRAREAGFPVAVTYGLTEAASQVATRPPGDPITGGLRPLAGTQLKIVDERGRARLHTLPGEICIRGGSVTSGYWKRPAATREALREGWLHTGDLGFLDSEGGLWVLDRRSDLIVSGGENIYPAEIESVLLEHPAIAEAGVAAEEDETYGQRPVAYLVAKADVSIDEDTLRAHCRERLAGFKCPVKFIQVAALPRTASGKLQRRKLASGGHKIAR